MSSVSVRLGNGRVGVIEADTFNRLLQYYINDEEEVREEWPTSVANGYAYRGLAVNGSETTSAVWDVVRWSFDSNGNITRIQYQDAIAWSNRANGW